MATRALLLLALLLLSAMAWSSHSAGWSISGDDGSNDPTDPTLQPGTLRYESPDHRLLVYLAPGQPRSTLDPGRWLTRFNRRRNFDENGRRAYTLSEVDVEPFPGQIVARQSVHVETDLHRPFTIQTVAVFRDAGPVQWGAIVNLDADTGTTHPRHREALSLIYAAERPLPADD